MSWLIWILAGAGVGWWLAGLRRRAAELIGWWLADPYAWIAVAAPYVALIVVVLLAAAHDFDWLPTRFYGIEGFLFGPRMIAIAFGISIGFLARCHRSEIATRAGEFYGAFLGGSKSAWALQSLVGLSGIFAIILAFNPGMLDRIETLKAGEIEAKFGSVSATTREAVRLNLSNFVTNNEFYFDDWMDFTTKFIEYRDVVTKELDDDQETLEYRKRMRNEILKYVEPLAIVINCFVENDSIESLRRSIEFGQATTKLRNKILAENGDGISFTGTNSFVELLRGLVTTSKKMLDDEISKQDSDRCRKFDELPEKIKKLETYNGPEEPHAVKEKLSRDKYTSLWFLDSYIPDFVGELTALTHGYTEKAKFMIRAKDKYGSPNTSKFLRPGMINFYYQLVGAKLRSEAMWPFIDEIKELDIASAGIDFILTESQKPSRFKTHTKEIKEIYYNNKFLHIKRYIELYYQRALGGVPITSEDRNRWIMFFRQAEAIQNLRYVGASTLSLDKSEGVALSSDDTLEWKKFTIKPGRQFNAEVGLALSSVLLTEKRGSAPSQACAIARFHLGRARDLLPRAADEEKMDIATRTRVEGFLEQVRARIDVSC